MLNTTTIGETDLAGLALKEAIDQLRAGDRVPRDAALGAFRRHLVRIQQHVRDEFETYRMMGVEAAQRLAALTDGVVRVLYDHAVLQVTGSAGLADPVAIGATGGYGRCMLAPFSSISCGTSG
jgi:[protein-PII] uridylyltransferase